MDNTFVKSDSQNVFCKTDIPIPTSDFHNFSAIEIAASVAGFSEVEGELLNSIQTWTQGVNHTANTYELCFSFTGLLGYNYMKQNYCLKYCIKYNTYLTIVYHIISNYYYLLFCGQYETSIIVFFTESHTPF